MEFILILFLIIFIIIYRSISVTNTQIIQKLANKIDQLLHETADLREELKDLKALPQNAGVKPIIPKEELSTPKSPPPPVYKPVEPAAPSPLSIRKPLPQRQDLKEVPAPQYEPLHVVKESWMDKWLRNNPDLEKFIGENLVNKIGIAVLVLGIAFFVKYAIDQNWINEVGRVCIGLLCGAILTALAHYLRNSYRSFSSVLAGGGVAVFYFTIAFAFHQYALLSQTIAFVLMVVITAFAVALALLYDKIELAIIAAVGGFLTPFLVSTGQGNYIVLFSYLIILNAGLLALAYFKRWPVLNILALFFTELIYGGWLIKILWEETPRVSYPLALLFATVLYLLFVGMNMIYQIRHKKPFRALDFSILLFLNASYFAAGILLLQQVDAGKYQGLFTLGAGIINLGLAWYFFRRQNADRNLVYLLIGLTLTFLSLTIPIQLKGHAITLFWSAEFVLLFWLYQRSRILLFHYASLLVAMLTIISLLMDWEGAALNTSSNLVLMYTGVQGLVTNCVVAAAFAAYGLLLKKEKEELPFNKSTLHTAAWMIAVVVAYLTAIFGVNLSFQHIATYEVPNVYHRLATELFVIAAIIWLYKTRNAQYSWLQLAAVCVYLVYHLFSVSLITGLRNGVLEGRYATIHLAFHWLSVAVGLYLVYRGVQAVRRTESPVIPFPHLAWIISLLLIIFFSQEVRQGFVALAYGNGKIPYLEEQYARAGLTIVWALCSFALMWLGMRHKNKSLRIISLSAFTLALLKLFFFDIADISEAGKIIAFILLGVLLLTISFMYQKLKKMIIDDGREL